jgi:TIR domain
MPYLAPRFDHDVFMSYAHGRRPGRSDAPLRNWSQKFIDLLGNEIYALRPDIGAVHFWDDRNIDLTAALTEELKFKVERSGLLLIMMSPAYLSSEWCTKELDWFKEQFLGRRRSPGRVFVIRAVSTNTELWPDFLKDSSGQPDIGFQFHQETTDIGTEPYGWPDLSERTREFNSMFATLRTTLIKRLEAIRAGLQSTPSPLSAPQGPTRPRRLYLHAPTAADNVRAAVETELRVDGYSIVPAVPRAATDSLSAWQAEVNARVQVAQKCDALTLLRPPDDPSFDDEFLEVGADELGRINAARRDRPLPCAVLDGSGTPFALAEYAKRSGIELFDLSDPSWRPEFKTWLEEARV